jgi:magnesium transporter
MNKSSNQAPFTESIQEHLLQVKHLLEKHALMDMASHQQEMPRAARHLLEDKHLHKRQLTDLREKLGSLHSVDIAYILASLPIEQRLLVWDLVKTERDGAILLEVSDAVRKSLITTMNREELRGAAEQLNANEIADLAPDLPHEVMRDVFKSLTIEEREQLRAAMSYPENSVGALMDFDMVSIREGMTLQVVSRYLRRFDKLPDHTDQLFVIDRDHNFIGVLPLSVLLVNEPGMAVAALVIHDTLKLQPDERAGQAVQSFERYDLVSAPVVDEDGKLIGRVTANTVVDYIRSESKNTLLNLAGLNREEDVFASVWKSVKNRWLWLALNLCTAFIASRVIGSFEHSIEKFVALATLMPIVAGLTGNTANQTTAIIFRSLTLGQITSSDARRLFRKEMTIAMLNGLMWGGTAGLFAYALYQNVPLGLVMTAAIILSLLLGAFVGIFIPLAMQHMGRAPTLGSGVILTAITGSSGFFIFLGLATLFLVH